jgi:hypothetical protein
MPLWLCNMTAEQELEKLKAVMMEIYSWQFYAQPHDETELTEFQEGFDACLHNVKVLIEPVLGLDGE